MKEGSVAEAGHDQAPMGSYPKTIGLNKGVSILDFMLRLFAAIGTLSSAIAMGTTNQTQTISFFTQFMQFKADYGDLPAFTFFVIANSVACGYLVLSLPSSMFHIFRSKARNTRIILVILDTAMLALVTAGASAAAAIVYLAHKGNASANWPAFCQQFNSFCQRVSGSLIGSFGACVIFILLIITSSVAISRR